MATHLEARPNAWAMTACITNFVAPGAGLVLLGGTRSGVAATVLFTAFVQMALWGFLLIPAVVTRPVAWTASAGAAAVWLIAQWLLWERWRRMGFGSRTAIQSTLDRIESLIARGEYALAHRAIAEAMLQWSQVEEVHVHRARLMTLMGRFSEARQSWELVLEINPSSANRVEAITALERLPREYD